MNIEKDIFKGSILNINKIINYGFKKEKNEYIYKTKIINDNFEVNITITQDYNICGKIIDLVVNDEYTAFRIVNQNGAFVNKVREEYEKILVDILKKCCDKNNFLFKQTNLINNFIKERLNVEAEFLFDSSPGCGIFRNKENKKWFALITNIDISKLDSSKHGEVEIINLKLDEEVKKYLKFKGAYPAYHMSKKKWISLILDGTFLDSFIEDLIIKSYNNIK